MLIAGEDGDPRHYSIDFLDQQGCLTFGPVWTGMILGVDNPNNPGTGWSACFKLEEAGNKQKLA